MPASPVQADDDQATVDRLMELMEAGHFDGYLRHRDDAEALAEYDATIKERVMPWRTPAEMTESTRVALIESLLCHARLRELTS